MLIVWAPAVPLMMTSVASSKSVTGSLKTTWKLIGLLSAGSFCPLAWSIVTVGRVVSYVTVLSVLVLAVFKFPLTSRSLFAAIDAVTVPSPVMPVTEISKVVWSLGAISVRKAVVAPAVPPTVISAVDRVAMSIGSLKVAIKWIGPALTGSA